MPNLNKYKNNMSIHGRNVGEALRYQSNQIMEGNWWTDPQAKVAYIYDYLHDDYDSQGNSLNRGMTYENTNKTKVFIKHIFDAGDSLSKDTPEMYIQFIPSFKLDCLTEDDEMYYFKTDYQDKYGSTPFVGCYIDIPDPDREGIYEKYLICKEDISNMFQKYLILKCDYNFQYVEIFKNKRIKRHMWGAVRSQSSYNSGLWTDRIFTTQEQQGQIMLPLNTLTEYVDTVHSDGTNFRVLMGAPTQHIKSWQISKLQDNQTPSRGIKMITLYQDEIQPDHDLIDVKNKEFYANYYSTNGLPAEDESPSTAFNATITTTSSTIKVGGSYKTFILSISDNYGNDYTSLYAPTIGVSDWKCYIDGVDETNNTTLITWLPQVDNSKIKMRLELDSKRLNYNYIGKQMKIECAVAGVTGTLNLSII